MANKKRKNKNAIKPVETHYDLATVELSEADKALLAEISLNRRAILRLGQVCLDHERRLQSLEAAVAELSDEEEPPIDIEGESLDEGEE